MSDYSPSTFTIFSGQEFVPDTLVGITYSFARESTPVYIMGAANPRSFRHRKVIIAGELVSTAPIEANGKLFDVTVTGFPDSKAKTIYGVEIVSCEQEFTTGEFRYSFVARETGPFVSATTAELPEDLID